MYDVLEHMGDPKRTLQECNRILKPGGILVVNYPDIGSWLSRLMRRRWIFLLSVHIYYFTRPTIKAMLAKTGFKVEVVKPHIQTLSLGYLIYRMEAYSKLLHKTSKPVVKALRMNNLQVPYWLGQTFVLARKP
ncbi:methyltransferase domain-containing protein [Candidatus Woesearchaeota archaeon]|nr:methyltransferase domain-containing protein [Candidatus Woesearchaeota archaeon]